MKFIRYFFLSFFCFFSYFAFAMSPKVNAPNWFNNVDAIFPKQDFIAEQGMGYEQEEARAEATSFIARQFTMSVKNSVSATINSIETNGELNETRQLVNNIDLESSVKLFAVKFTEPYYDKSEKKYYSVAYIERNAAFLQYEPELKQKKAIFYNFFDKAESESETNPFEKYLAYKDAWNNSFDFLESLSFARMLNPQKESPYEFCREQIASIPVCMKNCLKNCALFVKVDSDYGNIMKQGISEVFADIGFKVLKNAGGENYSLVLFVDDCAETDGDIFAIYPEIEMNLLNKNGKILYSYSYKAKKFAAYSMEKVREKAYSKIITEIQENVSGDF